MNEEVYSGWESPLTFCRGLSCLRLVLIIISILPVGFPDNYQIESVLSRRITEYTDPVLTKLHATPHILADAFC